MFRRISLLVLLLPIPLATGCQSNYPHYPVEHSGQYSDVRRFAPNQASGLIKEAAAEEMQESRQRPRTGPAGVAHGAPLAAPNTPMTY